MPSNTPIWALPYPVAADTVDVPRDVQALADNLDGKLGTGIIAYGTAFPATPADGRLAVLVDSITSPTYQWLFRYNAGSSASYKWEFIGGGDKITQVVTMESTASTAFVDLATVGPSFVVPRAGNYLVGGAVRINANAVLGMVGVKVGAQVVIDVGDALVTSGAIEVQIALYETFYFANAGDTIKFQYKVNTGSASFGYRAMRVRPKELS